MHWYISKLVFQITCGHGNHTPQFEEQWRLVGAENKQAAIVKSLALGSAAQNENTGKHDHPVKWKFVNVAALFLLESVDGASICSHVSEVADATSYIEMINENAKYLQQQGLSHQHLNLI